MTTLELQTVPDAIRPMNIVVVGNTGSGKSATARAALVEPLIEANRRGVIIDPTGVWWGLRFMADGTPGYPVAIVGGLYGDAGLLDTDGEHIAQWIAAHDGWIIVDVSEMNMGERHRFATDFFASLYKENRRPLHVIIDEADEFSPQNPLPETRRMLHHVDRMVRRGRVKGFRITLITQRPAVLHKNVLSQANVLIAMRLLGSQDRDAVQLWIKGQASLATGKEVLNTLASLHTGEGWLWAPSHGILHRGRFAFFKTFDSSRTPGDDEPPVEPPGPFHFVNQFIELRNYLKRGRVEQDIEREPSSSLQQSDEGESIAARGQASAILLADRQGFERGHAEGVRRGYAGATITLQNKLMLVMQTADEFMEELRQVANHLDIPLDTIDADYTPPAPIDNAAVMRAVRKSAQNIGKHMTTKLAQERIRENVTGDGLTPGGKRLKDEVNGSGASGRLLSAIASYPVRPLRWAEVAIIANMSGNSGYFRLGRRHLIEQGLITDDNGAACITKAGLKIAGQPTPASYKQVLQDWVSKIDAPGDEILQLLAKHRRRLSKSELGDQLGKSTESGYWRKGIRALRNAGLVEQEGSSYVLSPFMLELAKTAP